MNPCTKIVRRQNAVNSVTHDKRLGAARSSAHAEGQDARIRQQLAAAWIETGGEEEGGNAT